MDHKGRVGDLHEVWKEDRSVRLALVPVGLTLISPRGRPAHAAHPPNPRGPRPRPPLPPTRSKRQPHPVPTTTATVASLRSEENGKIHCYNIPSTQAHTQAIGKSCTLRFVVLLLLSRDRAREGRGPSRPGQDGRPQLAHLAPERAPELVLVGPRGRVLDDELGRGLLDRHFDPGESRHSKSAGLRGGYESERERRAYPSERRRSKLGRLRVAR